jgi:hypothetical protein
MLGSMCQGSCCTMLLHTPEHPQYVCLKHMYDMNPKHVSLPNNVPPILCPLHAQNVQNKTKNCVWAAPRYVWSR